MSDSAERPGGLLVLAIINFIFGGMAIMNGLVAILLFAIWDTYDWTSNEFAKAMKKGWDDMGFEPNTQMLIATFFDIVASIIGIVAALGYLKMQRVRGRRVGNVYAIVSILAAIYAIVAMSEMSFGILGLLSFIYPVLTLVLINTVFKDDLVND